MVIPNMMAESGAKSAYLEPDEAVFAWLGERLAARTGEAAGQIQARLAAVGASSRPRRGLRGPHRA